MGYSFKLPPIERNSFYSPYQYNSRGKKYRDALMKKKREITTTYYEYIYDENGNCKMIPHPYENKV